MCWPATWSAAWASILSPGDIFHDYVDSGVATCFRNLYREPAVIGIVAPLFLARRDTIDFYLLLSGKTLT